jgi:hypothetical protein
MSARRVGPAAPILAAVVLAACGSTSPEPSAAPAASSSTAPAAASAAPVVEAPTTSGPTSFNSKVYGYSVTVPAGWASVEARRPWDGKGSPGHDAPEADQWVSPGPSSAWAMAAPSAMSLASYTRRVIADTFTYHGNNCPKKPAAKDPVTIGGSPGTLLAWNCGILINIGVMVHSGVAYAFGFRDPAVHAASDATDRSTFIALLESVRLDG